MSGSAVADSFKGDPHGLADLLQQELRQEKAYIYYLEELLSRAGVTIADFNTLPEWQRKAYFDKVARA